MSELKPCPYTDGYPDDLPGRLRWWAKNCDRTNTGCQIKDMLRMAADEIDRRTQPDEPLTLEELRGMDGEPVRIDDDGETFYGIVSLSGNCFDGEELITLASGDFYLFRDMDVKVYPLLYRRKPEPEGGEG